MREALALEVGRAINSILFTVVLVCSCVLLPIYWWFVARTPRGRLLWLVCVPFAVVFVCLAVALSWYPRDRTVAFVYFVALTSGEPVPGFGVLERDGGRMAAGTRETVLRLRGGGRQRRCVARAH